MASSFLDQSGLETLVSSIKNKYDMQGVGNVAVATDITGAVLYNDTYYGQPILRMTGHSDGFIDSMQYTFYPHIGDWFTLSFWAKSSEATSIRSHFYPSINNSDNAMDSDLTTDWKLIQRSICVKSIGQSEQYCIPVRLLNSTSTIYFTLPVLEYGRVSHPCSPTIPGFLINSLF